MTDFICVESEDLALVAEAFGDGPGIVFAHGLTRVRQGSKRQFAAPAERYRIVCHDLRGHGDSTPVTDPALKTSMDWVPFADLDVLKTVTCPTCIIGWDDDALHPLALAERMARIMPNAILKVMPTLPEVFINPGLVGNLYATFLEEGR